MSMQDPISDLLTRIRNGQMVAKKSIVMPSSKTKAAIARVLHSEGYVGQVSVSSDIPSKPQLHIELRYFEGKPVIDQIKRVSRPGLRIYKSSSDIPVVKGGLGVAILSTCKGVMVDKIARREGIGGEVLCTVS